MTPALLLDPSAITSCPVKVQNAVLFGEKGADSVSEERVEHLDCVDSTLAAMQAGAALIVDAELPPTRHLKGRAELLVRGEDNADGTPGYYPAITLDHPALRHIPGDSGDVFVSFPPAYGDRVLLPHYQFRWDKCEADTLRLAHLWTLLEACGHAAGSRSGPSSTKSGTVPGASDSRANKNAQGIIVANDEVDGWADSPAVWVDLNDHQIRTYTSSSAGSWRRRSPLNRFAHESKFLVRVAAAARAHMLADPLSEEIPPLAVAPVRIKECERCVWWDRCGPELHDDISLKIERAPLDTKEITVLRSLGVRTVSDLAQTDVEALLPDYLPRVAHRGNTEDRLRLAAHRSRLLAEGIRLERLTTGPIYLPSADIEIDFDIESSAQERVYLWGFLVHDRRLGAGEPTYHPISHFGKLAGQGEITLANSAGAFLRDLLGDLGWSASSGVPVRGSSARGGQSTRSGQFGRGGQAARARRRRRDASNPQARADGGNAPSQGDIGRDQRETEIGLENPGQVSLHGLSSDPLGSGPGPVGLNLGQVGSGLNPVELNPNPGGSTPSVLIWHYSSYETSTIARLAASTSRDTSGIAWLRTITQPLFVDLLPVVKKHFFGVEGLGLKKVATDGAGFSWRDPDPSGLNSQHWFDDALEAPTEEERDQAKARILDYNEDDVRATWALRQWLRSLS